jgi:peptide/nickel transport system permease protein
MAAYALRRIGTAIVLVWVVASLIFMLLHIIPGDPAELLLSQGGVAPDPAQIADLREQMGLDRPVLVQYRDYLGGVLHGDLGASLQDGHPVSEEVWLRLPRTLELIAAAAVLSLLVGLPFGVMAATRAGTAFDRLASGAAGAALSIPVFVVGTLAVLVFAQALRLVPAGGYVAPARNPGQHILLLLMPAATIAVGLAAVVFRTTRSAMLEILGRDFIRAARAKGVPPQRIIVAHVLRNALGPIVTVFGLQVGTLLGGTVLVEYVFNWPGLSGYLVNAIEARDYPEVVGIVLVISVLFVLLNLVVDLLYALLDPRIRHAR